MEKKKKYLAGIILGIVISVCYIAALYVRCPKLELSQKQLYGEGYQNLKDFEVENEGLKSLSDDPWIEYTLDKKTRVKAIELLYSNMEAENQWGEVFDMDTWTSNTFWIKNGKNIVSYQKISEMQHLRFDLVAQQGVHCTIEKIVINPRDVIAYDALKKIVCIAVAFSLFVSIGYKLRITVYEKKWKKVVAWGTGIIALGLAAVALYWNNSDDVAVQVSTWLYLLNGAFLFLIFLQMSNKKLVFNWIESFLFALLNIGIIELASGNPYNFQLFFSGIQNVFIFLAIFIAACWILRREKRAMILLNVLMFILAITNHYLYEFRGKPFELIDALMIETATTVVGNYEFGWSIELSFVVLLELGIICYIILYQQPERKRHEREGIIVLEIVMLMFCVCTPEISYWNMDWTVESYGYLNSFIGYARQDFSNKKPKKYSQAKVKEILEQYGDENEKKAEDTEKPNVIVIMNEAFADLPKTYGFETNKDGMPFIHSLKDNTVKGKMLVSVLGGGTANTEFEFQTGNTMAFLNAGNTPYVQYIRNTQESVTQELKKYGYQTYAFHPCVRDNYNRDNVYEHLGFERYISIEDQLKYRDELREMQSDEADMKNIIDLYERSDKEKPFYIFNVTMQNHSGYSTEESEIPVTIYPKQKELQFVQLKEYLSLIRETDRAFKQLVSYFKQQDKKTIILMFGDHQPGLDGEVYDAMLAASGQEMSLLEMEQKKHEVPFVMWANYDIDAEDKILTSPAYLRPMLLEKAGLPLGNYDKLLQACSQEYPAINAYGYYDTEGNLFEHTDSFSEESILYQWQIVQYGNLLDRKQKADMWKLY